MTKIKPTEIRNQASSVLTKKWGTAALITLVYFAISIAADSLQSISLLPYYGVFLLLLSPMSISLLYMFLDLKREKPLQVSSLFNAYENYLPIIAMYILNTILVFLGMILLIVPGVILSLGLSMSFYILRDQPELGVIGSMKASWNMMNGHKMEYFLLALSFTGWVILGMITLMIGFLWIIPYVCTADACFYERLKNQIA